MTVKLYIIHYRCLIVSAFLISTFSYGKDSNKNTNSSYQWNGPENNENSAPSSPIDKNYSWSTPGLSSGGNNSPGTDPNSNGVQDPPVTLNPPKQSRPAIKNYGTQDRVSQRQPINPGLDPRIFIIQKDGQIIRKRTELEIKWYDREIQVIRRQNEKQKIIDLRNFIEQSQIQETQYNSFINNLNSKTLIEGVSYLVPGAGEHATVKVIKVIGGAITILGEAESAAIFTEYSLKAYETYSGAMHALDLANAPFSDNHMRSDVKEKFNPIPFSEFTGSLFPEQNSGNAK